MLRRSRGHYCVVSGRPATRRYAGGRRLPRTRRQSRSVAGTKMPANVVKSARGENHDTMERRCGHRRKSDRFVRLKMRDGLSGFGRIRNVSITGAWIATGLPAKLLSYVQVAFTAMRKGRKIVARIEGLIVRVANQGFRRSVVRIGPSGGCGNPDGSAVPIGSVYRETERAVTLAKRCGAALPPVKLARSVARRASRDCCSDPSESFRRARRLLLTRLS
jgi:hypothetical protein